MQLIDLGMDCIAVLKKLQEKKTDVRIIAPPPSMFSALSRQPLRLFSPNRFVLTLISQQLVSL